MAQTNWLTGFGWKKVALLHTEAGECGTYVRGDDEMVVVTWVRGTWAVFYITRTTAFGAHHKTRGVALNWVKEEHPEVARGQTPRPQIRSAA